jgi:hypothetical protein
MAKPTRVRRGQKPDPKIIIQINRYAATQFEKPMISYYILLIFALFLTTRDVYENSVKKSDYFLPFLFVLCVSDTSYVDIHCAGKFLVLARFLDDLFLFWYCR